MTVNKKQVKLFKDFNPDHNGECLGCDAWADDCECLYLIDTKTFLENKNRVLYNHKVFEVEKTYDEHVVLNGEVVKSEFVYKIIATPDQIGWVRTRPEEMGEALLSLSDKNKEDIFLYHDGNCEIEMNFLDGGEDGGNGYREPKLINGKVIIQW